MFLKVDVKEEFDNEKKKKIKESFTPKRKPKHFVELTLWNRKKNDKLKHHAYSISKLRNKINKKTKLKYEE